MDIFYTGGKGKTYTENGLSDIMAEQQQLTEGEKLKRLHDVFSVFDTNGDGFINRSELKDIFNSLQLDVEDKQIKGLIKKNDCDGNKVLDFTEFLNLMEPIIKNKPELFEPCDESDAKQIFRMFDRDNDGLITEEEMKRALVQTNGPNEPAVTDLEVQDMIRQADKDDDGKLTYEEFEAMYTKIHGK